LPREESSDSSLWPGRLKEETSERTASERGKTNLFLRPTFFPLVFLDALRMLFSSSETLAFVPPLPRPRRLSDYSESLTASLDERLLFSSVERPFKRERESGVFLSLFPLAPMTFPIDLRSFFSF